MARSIKGRAFGLVVVLGCVGGVTQAQAAPVYMEVTGLSGPFLEWESDGTNLTLSTSSPTVGTAEALLRGNSSSPGGNLELGKFGNPGGSASTVTGTIGGQDIELSSLVLSDWTDALTYSYIDDAAASVGLTLSSTEREEIKENFFTFDIGGYNPWQLVSDPNVNYVFTENGSLSIGLAGFLNAAPILAGFFNAALIANGSDPINPSTDTAFASEVIKVTYGGETQFLYSFNEPNPSGLVSTDPTASYDGNYEISVPEPATWLLIASGLLVLVRRLV